MTPRNSPVDSPYPETKLSLEAEKKAADRLNALPNWHRKRGTYQNQIVSLRRQLKALNIKINSLT